MRQKQQNRKVKWSYSKIMDEPTPRNCYWPVKWVEKKHFPPLRNRKSCCAEQSSGKRGGNEQVYLSEPPKTVQEALQEAMKGSPGCRADPAAKPGLAGTSRAQVGDPRTPAPREQGRGLTMRDSKQKLSEECRKH